MNSVERHLNAESKAATLIAMRSAKKEVLLVVEGDTDVDLLSESLGVPRSNVLSCNGKETLMLVFGMAPQKGIDPGSIFIRDRDHDSVSTNVSNGVLMLVTMRYDIEMEVLENRIFHRILSEFLHGSIDAGRAADEFAKLCKVAAHLGAARLYSQQHGVGLDFDKLNYSRFLDYKRMNVDVGNMLQYLFAKSKKPLANLKSVVADISSIISSRAPVDVVCSKEFIEILQIALSRHYAGYPAAECAPSVLSKMVRIAVIHDDLRAMPLYTELKSHVQTCGFIWVGNVL